MNKHIPGLILLFLITAIVGFIPFKSQSQDRTRNIPSLNGHEFIGTTASKLPFTNTSFEMDLGLGNTVDFNFPVNLLDDELVRGLEGDILFALLGFKYNQKIRDWISFYVNYSMVARVGTNVQSLLFHGINTVDGFQTGVMFKLYNNEKHQLSGSVDIEKYSGSFINVKRFVEDILDSIPNPSLTQNVPALLSSAGIYHAWGLSQVTGITFHCILGYGESFDREQEEFRYDMGVGFDFNFYARYNVPLGVSLSYNIVSQPELVYLVQDIAHAGTFRISYTGTTDFILAIENATLSVPIDGTSNRPFFLVNGITMKYYFN